ncbi:MAG: hypothetical protein ACJAYU_002924 [Bradymonadia bacterium]|jgi:hypothetical protein
MKKLTAYDQANASTLMLVSPEWPKVRVARQAADSFDVPEVPIPTETRTIAGRRIRLAEAGLVDAPLVVLLSPFPESIWTFPGSWEALTAEFRVIAIDLPGFGASEGDRHDMSPKAQGDHLAAIFAELEPGGDPPSFARTGATGLVGAQWVDSIDDCNDGGLDSCGRVAEQHDAPGFHVEATENFGLACGSAANAVWCFNLGHRVVEGIGTVPDLVEAERVGRSACEAGHNSACEALAEITE